MCDWEAPEVGENCAIADLETPGICAECEIGYYYDLDKKECKCCADEL